MSDSRPALPIYALLMVAIAGGSTMLFEAPFESTRPVHEQTQSVDSRSMDAPGRLWQDPLTVALQEHRRRVDRKIGVCDWDKTPYIREILNARSASGTASPPVEDEALQTENCVAGRFASLLQDLANDIGESGHQASAADKKLLIMPVFVPGGFYQSDVESRRRYRYAISMALMRQEFMPLENRILGHFIAPPTSSNDGEPEKRLVAFELLQRHGRQTVLVLWVPDRFAAPWPPAFLNESECPKPGDLTSAICQRRANVEYAVIGPAGSETLIDLVTHAVEEDGSGIARHVIKSRTGERGDSSPRTEVEPDFMGPPEVTSVARRQVPLISPFATVSGIRVWERVQEDLPDDFPDVDLPGKLRPENLLSDDALRNSTVGDMLLRDLLTLGCAEGSRGKNCFSDFIQVRRDDSYLAWMVARELVARGVDTFDCRVDKPLQSVALVGEADRTFTKAWLEEMWFQARLKCDRTKLSTSWNASDKAERARSQIRSKRFRYKTRYCKGSDKKTRSSQYGCVSSFSYLQGLDGAQASVPRGSSGSQRSALGFETVDPTLLARPVGDSQFDYLRRLGDEVRKEDQILRRNGGQGIRAVGIFGSDIYDKLLILQAMQQELPDAIYFTNDLDARLLHPANYQWTRNLLVASSYGLTLGHDLCRAGAPPFRDGYQSSAYVSVMIALDYFGWLNVTHLANSNCRWRTPEMYPTNSEVDTEFLFKATKPPGLFSALDDWEVPRPRLFEISRTGADDITPEFPYRGNDASLAFNTAVHGEFGHAASSRESLVTLAFRFALTLAVLIPIAALLYSQLVRRGLFTPSRTPTWILSNRTTSRPVEEFPHAAFGVAGLILLALVSVQLSNMRDDIVLHEGVFDLPAIDWKLDICTSATDEEDLGNCRVSSVAEDARSSVTSGVASEPTIFDVPANGAPPNQKKRLLSSIDSRMRCDEDNKPFWCSPNLQKPVSLAAFALAPSIALLALWATMIFVRWRRFTQYGHRVYHISPTLLSLQLSFSIFVGFFILMWLSSRSPFFEQIGLLSGTSFWPSAGIQVIGLLVAIPAIIVSSRRLWQSLIKQVRTFFGDRVRFDPGNTGFLAPVTWGMRFELEELSQPEPLSKRVASYVRFCRGSRRFARTLFLFVIYVFFAWFVYDFREPPPPPIRGIFAQATYWYLMFAILPLLMFSALFSTDATMLCGRMLRSAASANTEPDFSDELVRETGQRLGLRGSGEDDPADKGIREYLRLDFIAQLTQPITPLIGVPFYLIAVLVVSRSSLFDNWHWELNVLVFAFAVGLFSVISAIRLRRAAEVARSDIVDRLQKLKRQSMSGLEVSGGISTAQVDSLIALVKSEERGAFNRWFKNPVVQALLLPFGGAGAIALLEFVLTVG